MTRDPLQVAKTPDTRSPLLRPNLFTGAIGAVIGYIIGVWIGHRVGAHLDWVSAIDQNDVSVLLGYSLGTIGYIAGLGLLDYPFRRLLGQRPVDVVKKDTGAWRYLTVSTDHKVIGMQYLWGIGVFFFIAGLNAMLIRTDLLRPTPPIFSPGQYLTIVGLHGSMMVMMVSSIILGPFGHYLVPLMIGARRMAFPRMEALTFWLTPLSGVVLLSAISYGGFPTGWTGYPPLALQANAGMDAYIFAFFLVAVAMVLNAINLMVTIITMRAPIMSGTR
jgi:cytochrome c oxidase subunit 1